MTRGNYLLIDVDQTIICSAEQRPLCLSLFIRHTAIIKVDGNYYVLRVLQSLFGHIDLYVRPDGTAHGDFHEIPCASVISDARYVLAPEFGFDYICLHCRVDRTKVHAVSPWQAVVSGTVIEYIHNDFSGI